MTLAFFSKYHEARREWALSQRPEGLLLLHLRPKVLPPLDGERVVSVAYEDLTKRDVWLRLHNLLGPETFLVFENPSRYPKITSDKVRHLRRLSMRFTGGRVLTDVVPFTLSVEYLYTPYSLLDRAILGYPHWYAFRENYQEIDEHGQVVNSLDFDVLARKVAPVSEIEYQHFLIERETVRFTETEAELARYQAKRAVLFEQYGEGAGPQKIITRLADHVHRYASRQACLLDIASETRGEDTVVFCNLQSYARDAQKALHAAGFKHCRASSYQLRAERLGEAGAVIYLESPIVHTHHLLDIEAALAPWCRVYHVLGTTKVDQYLYREIDHELQQIDGFTRALWKEKHGGL